MGTKPEQSQRNVVMGTKPKELGDGHKAGTKPKELVMGTKPKDLVMGECSNIYVKAVASSSCSKSEYWQRASRRFHPMRVESTAVNSTKCGYKEISCLQVNGFTASSGSELAEMT
ncbi:hypothetical protein DAPPUDRAFT_253137 [Daphnia pulex]|uniref:Uncharacterized protein n=1 Tax=Daphnia pulex TaxID=6669 RepID=E9H486_DAPPU|nr:hypothetical protein DAPPUDRAFT_253137 [Daphnia pulex]|eukprot:EFX73480.1 hypothetical protein DAPPUDRAFT_253137 [Daphnia pulex]